MSTNGLAVLSDWGRPRNWNTPKTDS